MLVKLAKKHKKEYLDNLNVKEVIEQLSSNKTAAVPIKTLKEEELTFEYLTSCVNINTFFIRKISRLSKTVKYITCELYERSY